MFVDQAADDLAVLQHERHLVAAHFQHRAAARAARSRVPETGIEETCIMDAELANERVERRHSAACSGGTCTASRLTRM